VNIASVRSINPPILTYCATLYIGIKKVDILFCGNTKTDIEITTIKAIDEITKDGIAIDLYVTLLSEKDNINDINTKSPKNPDNTVPYISLLNPSPNIGQILLISMLLTDNMQSKNNIISVKGNVNEMLLIMDFNPIKEHSKTPTVNKTVITIIEELGSKLILILSATLRTSKPKFKIREKDSTPNTKALPQLLLQMLIRSNFVLP